MPTTKLEIKFRNIKIKGNKGLFLEQNINDNTTGILTKNIKLE